MPPAGAPQAGTPKVSVIMATYNGARFIRDSIDSVLAQTLRDFELIVTDDCSTDGTAAILDGIADPRLRVLRNAANLGVVGSRNRCFAAARGQYVAMLDHDDLSRPTRLAQQAAYLDAHPGTVLVGTAAHTLQDGALAPTRHPARTSPELIRWLLLVDNPLVCSSIMVRADAVRRLDAFMREDLVYADDYDLYHRLKALGDVARLDEPLTIYRLHPSNTFRRHEDTMTANAVKALAPSYQPTFGDGAQAAASLVVRHFMTGRPVPDLRTMGELQGIVARLMQHFAAAHPMDAAGRAAMAACTDDLWRRMLRVTASQGGIAGEAGAVARASVFPSGAGPSASDRLHRAMGAVPGQGEFRRRARGILRRPPPPPAPVQAGRLFGAAYDPIPVSPGKPPTLYVVVDTEAEFDWDKPFAQNLMNVTAMDDIGRGQAVFDRYGLRPIYVIDYPVASQASSVAQLRGLLARDACCIGAHLHPWTTPPHKEQIGSRNSFPGNLPPDLEEQKLAVLLDTIRANLGVSPLFYKAGRYGVGQATAALLVRHGIKVDLSVLPGTDLSAAGGPDFSGMGTVPYRVRGQDLVTVPMTRSRIGLAPGLPWLDRAVQRAVGRAPGLARLQPVLSRLRISDTITLTPEGVTAAEQMRLVRALVRRGTRLFVLHYHSPSLSPGHTPYVRTAADADRFVERIAEVCRFFFEELGGMPGYPPDLANLAGRPDSPAPA